MCTKKTASENGNTKKSVVWRLLKWMIVSVVLLIALTAGGVYYYYNYGGWKGVVRDLVHTYGSAATGTEVSIGGIDLSLSNGAGSIGDLIVGNPQGYTQDYIIRLGNIAVSVNKDSIVKVIKNATDKNIKSETIVINEIRIDKPQVMYELKDLKQNNVSDVMKNLNKGSSKKMQPAAEDPNAKTYTVAIKKVIVADGKAGVAASLLGSSQSLSLNLPTITITNVGTEKQGITIEDGLIRIFQEILKTTTNVVAKADLSGLLNGVGNIAGVATDTAGKAVNAATGAVTETAGKAVDGVTSGVKGLTDGVGGLFKK